MVRVKYCVFTLPLVVTAVQTHGGVQSALRHTHAPTRNEAGTYIRASVASDLDTLSTRKQPNQSSNGDVHIFVGWVGGTPERFLILWLSRVCLVLFCLAWSPCIPLSVLPAFVSCVCLVALPLFCPVPLFNLTELCRLCLVYLAFSLCFNYSFKALTVYLSNLAYLFVRYCLTYLLSVLDFI